MGDVNQVASSGGSVAWRAVKRTTSNPNQAKNRIQSIGLLDRTLGLVPDEALVAAVEALSEEHREAFDGIVKADAGADLDAAQIRAAAQSGRLDGTLESIALIVTDASLADCIEQLGDHADLPTTDQLRDVLPGLIERHGKEVTQLMLASTIAGDAPAAPIIRDLLKNDDLVKLPSAEPKPLSPVLPATKGDDAERAALKAKRAEARKAKQEAARIAREQSARARRRA